MDVKATFEDWMKSVNEWCHAFSGMDIHDLPDCPFADWFEAGVSARSAAKKALKNAKKG